MVPDQSSGRGRLMISHSRANTTSYIRLIVSHSCMSYDIDCGIGICDLYPANRRWKPDDVDVLFVTVRVDCIITAAGPPGSIQRQGGVGGTINNINKAIRTNMILLKGRFGRREEKSQRDKVTAV